MSAISKLPLELRNLVQDWKVPAVVFSGWPPPSILHTSHTRPIDDSSITNVQSSDPTSLTVDDGSQYRKVSIGNNEKSYFEKLQSGVQDRSIFRTTAASISTLTRNPLDYTLDNLIESIRPPATWNSNNEKKDQSQVKLLKQIYAANDKVSGTDCKNNGRQCYDGDTFLITTLAGNILFDFTNRVIDYTIHIQLMQLVRFSHLDKLIEKIFHKSGEYHHVEYRENRRQQLEKNGENHQSGFFPKSSDQAKLNYYLTMAKAVHYRSSSSCFVLDGFDISSRFHYDRNIVQNACRRFHNDIHADASTKRKEDDHLTHTVLLSSYAERSAKMTRILVLCTNRMRQIYRLFESLLKPDILSEISLIYVTFDQLKPFLIQYEQRSHENWTKDTLKPPDFQETSSIKVLSDNKIWNQSTFLPPSHELKKDKTDDTKMTNEHITTDRKEENHLDKIELSNAESVLGSFRTSSLILILMKHLDESYLTTLIQWYIEVIHGSALPSTLSWNIIFENCWLITSDYQRAETVFDIPKSNLFLWPTAHDDFDHTSIVISSILSLPIALNINYQNYLMLIDGMSIVDKHCRETTIDQNVCIQMALLRIWASISGRKTTAIVTNNESLQYFDEYITTLLTEYDQIYKSEPVDTYTSIHTVPTATISPQQYVNEQNRFSYDIITLSGTLKKRTTNNEHVFHPHTLISLDQLTPLTLGVLMGIYQISLFFEGVIRDDQYIPFDVNPLHLEPEI